MQKYKATCVPEDLNFLLIRDIIFLSNFYLIKIKHFWPIGL